MRITARIPGDLGSDQPMTIDFQCPDCGQPYQLGDHLAGQQARCKTCGAAITIPAAGTAAVPEGEPTVLDYSDVVEEAGAPAPAAGANPYQAPGVPVEGKAPPSRPPQAGGDETVATI